MNQVILKPAHFIQVKIWHENRLYGIIKEDGKYTVQLNRNKVPELDAVTDIDLGQILTIINETENISSFNKDDIEIVIKGYYHQYIPYTEMKITYNELVIFVHYGQ